jgi:hypothetical protein
MREASNPKPSSLYRIFWKFAAERQRIFFRRVKCLPPPHTSDPILLKYRFTNAYRAADRVSQYLIRRVIYQGSQQPAEIVFRSLLFRTFNRIETWEHLSNFFGELQWREFSAERFANALDVLFERGETVYSSAYIMPSRAKEFSDHRKHRNHLRLIDFMMRDDLPARLQSSRSLREVYETYLRYPLFGPFLAFQFAIDINYSAVVDFSEMDFVVAGPGARSGIRKCFLPSTSLSHEDVIRYVTDHQEAASQRFGESFDSLWGRPLQLIDVQNLFCEVDKYTRASDPSVLGIGGRTRLKRLYRSNSQLIEYWFPPKWKLER